MPARQLPQRPALHPPWRRSAFSSRAAAAPQSSQSPLSVSSGENARLSAQVRPRPSRATLLRPRTAHTPFAPGPLSTTHLLLRRRPSAPQSHRGGGRSGRPGGVAPPHNVPTARHRPSSAQPVLERSGAAAPGMRAAVAITRGQPCWPGQPTNDANKGGALPPLPHAKTLTTVWPCAPPGFVQARVLTPPARAGAARTRLTRVVKLVPEGRGVHQQLLGHAAADHARAARACGRRRRRRVRVARAAWRAHVAGD